MAYKFYNRQLAQNLYKALTEDAFYIAMEASVEGNQETQREAMLRYMDYSVQEAHQYGILKVTEDARLGAALWSKPTTSEMTQRIKSHKTTFLSNHMGENSLSIYRTITDFMSTQSGPLIPPQSWYLSILAIAPGHQSRGLGLNLVSSVLQQADSRGIPTYLETFTPRNKTFYSRLGYEDVAVILEPTTRSEYSLMLRPSD